MNRKGSALVAVLIVATILIIAGGLWYYEAHQPVSYQLSNIKTLTATQSTTYTVNSNQAPSSSPTLMSGSQPSTNPSPLSSGPIISSLTPSSGIGGTQVTITGSGFLASHDYYQSGIQTHDDGTTAVEFGPVLVNATFIDGNHMAFIVPTSSPVFGRKCGDVNCPGPIPPGNYNVWIVGGGKGNSNSKTFTVASATVTSEER